MFRDENQRGVLGRALSTVVVVSLGAAAGVACAVHDGSEAQEQPENVGSISQAADSGARFGTYCTGNYQNNWREALPESNTRCSWFNNELDDTDQKIFYFNLVGKKFYLEKFGDHQADNKSADDVDLLFVNTHGGAWTNPMTSTLAMWDQDQRAFSKDMRLGDSASWGGGLAILATYACETLKNSDNNFWARLGPMFSGGLKMALGSHDKVFDGTTTNEVGEDFADNLQHSYTFASAWSDGLSDWNADQDVAVAATGTNSTNCNSRKNNMKWQNYGGYPFLRDGQIGWVCWSTWDNL